jgi:hypothetical protein
LIVCLGLVTIAGIVGESGSECLCALEMGLNELPDSKDAVGLPGTARRVEIMRKRDSAEEGVNPGADTSKLIVTSKKNLGEKPSQQIAAPGWMVPSGTVCARFEEAAVDGQLSQ